MKTKFLFVTLILSSLMIKAQDHPLYIGMNAPEFKAQSTMGDVNFPGDFFNKWKILFSHPADFTPVCTSEIMAIAERNDEFKKLNTEMMVISTDGLNSHIQWVKSIESISRVGKPGVKIDFPIIADNNLIVSRMYNMMRHDTTDRRNVRSVVFVDPDNKIRAFFVYPDNIGRSVDELLRTLLALQTADKNQVLCPANWKQGDDVLISAPKTMEDSEKLRQENNPKLYSLTWYMWYKKMK